MQNFNTTGRLTSYDLPVVIGRKIVHLIAFGERPGVLLSIEAVCPEKLHITAVASNGIHFRRRCLFRHKYDAAGCEFLHRASNRCPVIAA